MKLTLCNIDYPAKVTYQAHHDYNEATGGRCIEHDLLFIIYAYSDANNHESGARNALISILDKIGKLNACDLIFSITKTCNSQITRDQIWDAMERMDMLGNGNSWQQTLFLFALDYYEHRKTIAEKK